MKLANHLVFLLLFVAIEASDYDSIMKSYSPSAWYLNTMLNSNAGPVNDGDYLAVSKIVSGLVDTITIGISNNSRAPAALTACQRDMNKMFTGNALKLPWATKYMDSWAKAPAGIQSGDYRKWYGDFDQCYSIAPVPSAGVNSSTTFSPQYCTVGIASIFRNDSNSFNLGINEYKLALMFGVCVPESCTEKEVNDIMNARIAEVDKSRHVLPSLTSCYNEQPQLSTIAIVTITIFSIIGFYMLIGLIVDIYSRCKMFSGGPKKTSTGRTISGHFAELAMCFSPLTNLEKLFKAPTAPSQQTVPNLAPVNALRTLSLLWVILGHVFALPYMAFDNLTILFDMMDRFTFQLINAGFYAVDTFFLLSGFLAYWTLYRALTKPSKSEKTSSETTAINSQSSLKPGFWLSLPFVYFHRYLRLTPPYAAMILVNTGLWAYIGSGPFYFQGTDPMCIETWWTNLLYVSNFVNVSQSCVAWTWYLAIDTQLFIFAPFAVYLFARKPVLGWLFCCFGIVAQMIVSAVLTVEYNLPPVSINNPDLNSGWNYTGFYEIYYIKPYTRMTPYIVGVMLCHLVVRHSNWLNKKLFSNRWLVGLGWLQAFALVFTLIHGLYGYFSASYLDPHWVVVVYNTLSKLAWSLGVGWILLCAALNRAGIVGDILSWPIWALPARLSYAAYLLHPLVLTYFAQTGRRPFHVTDISISFLYPGIVAVTFLLSAVFSIAFESPVIGLQRIMTGRAGTPG